MCQPDELPPTATKMYESFILHTICHYLKRVGKIPEDLIIKKLEQFPSVVYNFLHYCYPEMHKKCMLPQHISYTQLTIAHVKYWGSTNNLCHNSTHVLIRHIIFNSVHSTSLIAILANHVTQ